jgi:hypothetical protein
MLHADFRESMLLGTRVNKGKKKRRGCSLATSAQSSDALLLTLQALGGGRVAALL